jgi:hypothetical protein
MAAHGSTKKLPADRGSNVVVDGVSVVLVLVVESVVVVATP